MSDHRSNAIRFAQENQYRFLEELKSFSEIPSISTDSRHKAEVQRAADWVALQLRRIGMDKVQIFSTAGHPVVYGELLKAGPQAKTVLIYGHYDVQPAEHSDGWESDPFTPEMRGENIFARGATDMKGQVMATLKSIEAILATGELPVNVKFMIEGEEEIGSPNLAEFIKENKQMLSCDVALNPDTGMLAPDIPTITYALRGLAYYEIRLQGPRNDLHSGVFGGVVHNPAQVLCELLAGMHDDQGHITLPGFYDNVIHLEEDEREELGKLPIDDNFYLEKSGAAQLWDGEQGFTSVERAYARPTLEINGIVSGFTGQGSKTVLPAQAMAKISMRLVPKQDPKLVHQQLLQYMETNAPPTVTWEVIEMAGSPASISERDSDGVQALARAMETVWGIQPLFKREGGTVPVVAQMKSILGVDAINSGFSLPGDNMHGPNEKLHLPTWYKGIDAFIHFFFNYAA